LVSDVNLILLDYNNFVQNDSELVNYGTVPIFVLNFPRFWEIDYIQRGIYFNWIFYLLNISNIP